MLTEKIREAQKLVKTGYWDLAHREQEVFDTLSPNDQVLWKESRLPLSDLLHPKSHIEWRLKNSGKEYLIAPDFIPGLKNPEEPVDSKTERLRNAGQFERQNKAA